MIPVTERLHFPFSPSSIGEGNDNPLQNSCLENPRDSVLVGCCLWGHTELATTGATQQQQQQQQQQHMVFHLLQEILSILYFKSESEVSQSCRTLCNPMDSRLHQDPLSMGFSRQEVLEWVAIFFSRESSQPRDRTQVSHIVDSRFTI